jgi:poly-gamma-glutamate capsule biosynthesis protein CapA/YwtB (metallophosphatase superfamily)
VYRRRRLAALLVAVGLVLVIMLFTHSGGSGDGPPLSPEQARRLQLDSKPVELTLSFSGDLLIHSPVYGRALALGGGNRYDFAPLFDELDPYVADADLAFCHVETPMTPAEPTSYPIFNTPPDLAKGIAQSGWDACDTASNHTLDQGEEGVGQTIAALDRAGVKHTGSATSERQARKPLMVEADGVRIAYLAYTTDTNGIPVPEPWTVNLTDAGRILDDARRAKDAGADAVIVNLHWASEVVGEYLTEPDRAQEQLVGRLARAPEITAIVGQGPHVVQPIRRVAGKTVVFSEGNLISNQGADAGLPEASQDGYVALLDLVVDGDGARVADARYVPVWVDHIDYTVLPVGPALEAGEGDAASLEASYKRTVSVVGREPATPEPEKLP